MNSKANLRAFCYISEQTLFSTLPSVHRQLTAAGLGAANVPGAVDMKAAAAAVVTAESHGELLHNVFEGDSTSASNKTDLDTDSDRDSDADAEDAAAVANTPLLQHQKHPPSVNGKHQRSWTFSMLVSGLDGWKPTAGCFADPLAVCLL